MNIIRKIEAPVACRPAAIRTRLLSWAAAPLSIGLLAFGARASGTPPTSTMHATPPCTANTCAPSTIAPSTSLPSGGRVQSGTASITQSGDTTTIRQTSQDVSISWQSFNVGANDTVDFIQPSASALAINRIGSTDGSKILGNLDANGQVWLVNPNGILFGRGAEVNVGGLVASTLSVNDPAFGSTTFNFAGTGAGSIVNQGTINAAPGGYVALLGKSVSNEGTISAKLGTVALGAGSAATLTFGGTGLVKMQVDENTLNAIAANGGLIQADGGTVVMNAGAKNALLASVVNNTGVIEARTVDNHDGTIELLAGMKAGTVTVGGILDASAPAGGAGGFIETDAAHVHVADDAKVTTLAAAGKSGNWLIDPTDFTIAPSGGDETGAQVGSALTSGNVTIQSSARGSGTAGNINVDDTVSWSANMLTLSAYNNININSALNGSGSASLALQYGQGAANGVINGVTATYNVNAPVNLPAGPNFSTLLGSGGSAVNYTVITSLGAAADATTAPATMTLQGVAATSNLADNYALGSNIDATATSTWNGGAGFTPIGSQTSNFTGSFDGLGHTINDLTINLPSTSYAGLFGYAGTSAAIQNVGLVGGSIGGSGAVGGLVGYNGGSVSYSYATGSVSGTSHVGGLVGLNEGLVSNSYATGNVNAVNADYVGGLVGFNSDLVSNSYATGSVTGAGFVGGLVGFNTSIISTGYATGSISGNFGVGGLVGYNSGSVLDGVWDTDTTGQMTSAGGTPLTSAQMRSSANFTGFNFTSTPGATGNNWVIVDANGTLNNLFGESGATLPMLASEYSTTINNAHQLQLMAMNIGANYTLGQNIDASATAGTSTDVWYGSTFVPIGNYATSFNGSFNGQGYVINNLTINEPNATNAGLFGAASANVVIQNVGLVGVSVSGSSEVGGLVADNYGSVSNSYATGSVSGLDFRVGGLVGYNEAAATISNSYAMVTVSGSGRVGGLVGENFGSISNSHATGGVIGSNDVGGLVGVNHGSATVGNSYATGTVSGSGDVGGLVGENDGSVSNSYATGGVSGSDAVGGLVGFNYGSATITNSYATGNLTGGGNDVGGLVGDNEASVDNSYATGGVNGYEGVGGLVGVNGSSISNSYSTGYVNGTESIGGLTGSNEGSVSNSYATGGVGGHQYVGGLLGFNDTTGTVTDSYSTGNVNGSFYVGGLVGSNNGGTVTNSFWDTTTSGQKNSSGGSPLIDSQMQTASSFTGWSISATGGSGDVWRIYQGNTYPLLTSFLTPLTLSAADATVTYNGSAQSGATLGAPIGGVFGSAATGTNAGFYNGYYSYQQGYDLTGGNLTINPAALTLSGTRVYDGTTVVAGSVLTATGVAGETFSITGAGDTSNLSSKDVQTNSTLSSVTGLELGTSSNGGLASNYTALGTTGSSISITPLALTGTSIAAASSMYGSTVTPGAVTLNGVLAADAGSVSATASIASPLYSTSNNLRAGSYAQTATLSGGDAFDYTFAGGSSSFTSPTANYTVSPLALTGASIASVSSIYGTPKPAGAVTLTGVIAGDVVGATANIVTPPNSTSGSGNLDAGSYSQTTSMLTGADAGNYSFTGGYTTPTANYTVARLALPVTGLSGTNKVYNGSAADPLAGKATIAPLAGDAVTLTGTGASDFANSNVGTGKAVIVSGYSLKGADDANYTIVQPSGLSANVTQLASVAWVGGASGLWSNASNWAGGAIPDYGNVANVTIPTGATVTYDSGVHGTAALSTLTSGGTLVVAAGELSTSGILTTAGYQQTGGLVDVGGTLSINSLTGGVALGNVTAGSLSVTSQAGAITQLGSTAIDVTGTTSLTAYNGKTGGSATRYNITLAQTGDTFAGAVSANGLNIDLLDKSKSGLILGSTTATGTLTEDSVAGAITQSASTAITVTGASSLTADNGLSGGRGVNYNITLAQPADKFGGAVSSTGLNINLQSAGALTLGNTNATGGLTATARGGALTQATSSAIDVTGLTSLTADNGVTGKGAVDYAVTLAQPADTLKGAVTAQGSAITLDDAVKLTAIVDSTGAVSLDAANELVVQGTVGTSLTTVTTGGSHSTTTFDATTIGTSLQVTSTGAVATATSTTALTVDGAGTKSPNSHVTVNGVVGAEIK